MKDENPYAWFDRPIEHYKYTRPLFAHQKVMADHMLTYHYGILAVEMGCISGDAIIPCNREGVDFDMTLADLYTNHQIWDSSIKTFVRSLKDGLLGLNELVSVLDKGVQPVMGIVLKSNKFLKCTADHEICVAYGRYIRADLLELGDVVLTGTEGVPYRDTITAVGAIDNIETENVYDIVMKDPYRNFVADSMVVHNCGKTLAAIEVIEKSEQQDWWWVGPRSAIVAVEEEFEKWNLTVTLQLMTYEGLKKKMLQWKSGMPAPIGVVCDESSRLKGPTSQRTAAALALSNAIREEHGDNGYVILMSGTPSPKSPADWWSQCEVAYPGFLREGTHKAFQFRLGFYKKEKKVDGFYWDLTSWRDDEAKCDLCGLTLAEHDEVSHKWLPSRDEISYLNKRLDGLVVVYHKKDCLDLPDKTYREIQCNPSKSLQKAAKMLIDVAPTAIQALTWVRELSDGFQYKETEVGREACVCACGGPDEDCDLCEGTGSVPIMKRTAKRVKCPKDDALRDLLDENIDCGRLIVFAGFQESIDRIRDLCQSQDWDVVQIDGRGWKVFSKEDTDLTPIKYWRKSDRNVVIVAHPASGGMGLTLTEARMAVYYSNDFSPESRSQSEDRGHRPGMDLNKGFTIVDLYNLHTDKYVRNILKDNRRLELITLGELKENL
jgi:hypothetical protein